MPIACFSLSSPHIHNNQVSHLFIFSFTMLPYIIIILVTVVVLGLIFGRKSGDEKSDYQPEEFKHSGHEWAFNGILDIDHPPHDSASLIDADPPLQLMVKKGYVHYELVVDVSKDENEVGLFHAVARASAPNTISILREGRVVAHVAGQVGALHDAIAASGRDMPAYAFIAAKGAPPVLYGEVCIAKP